MQPIYAIIESGGEYEDAWTHVKYVTDDQVRGQQFVDKMNDIQETIRNEHARIQAWNLEYIESHPAPDSYHHGHRNEEYTIWYQQLYDAMQEFIDATTDPEVRNVMEEYPDGDHSYWDLEKIEELPTDF